VAEFWNPTGSRRDIDIPEWLFALIGQITPRASRCRCPRRDDGTSLCGSSEAFLFLGSEGGHARRSNYSPRIFRPAADGIYPPQKRRANYHTEPWRVHCTAEPWPGIPIPMKGTHRSTAERQAECSWAPLIAGLTPHGLRHGHQTAMRRDRVPRVLRRERLGHGPSGDIADRYTHIDDEMITEMLASLTRRLQSAVTERAQIDKPGAPNRVRPSRFWTRGWPRSGPGKGVLSQKALPIALPVAPSGAWRVLTRRSDLGGHSWYRTSDPSLVRGIHPGSSLSALHSSRRPGSSADVCRLERGETDVNPR
jgi:hypothetical protein